MDPTIVDRYEQEAGHLGLSIRGLTREDMLRRPPADAKAGAWTIHEVVIHLADAEAAMADRIKRIIAEDEPTLLAWDENKFASRLMYEDQSAEDAAAVDLTRKQLARVLRKLEPAAFDRAGTHSERGRDPGRRRHLRQPAPGTPPEVHQRKARVVREIDVVGGSCEWVVASCE